MQDVRSCSSNAVGYAIYDKLTTRQSLGCVNGSYTVQYNSEVARSSLSVFLSAMLGNRHYSELYMGVQLL